MDGTKWGPYWDKVAAGASSNPSNESDGWIKSRTKTLKECRNFFQTHGLGNPLIFMFHGYHSKCVKACDAEMKTLAKIMKKRLEKPDAEPVLVELHYEELACIPAGNTKSEFKDSYQCSKSIKHNKSISTELRTGIKAGLDGFGISIGSAFNNTDATETKTSETRKVSWKLGGVEDKDSYMYKQIL